MLKSIGGWSLAAALVFAGSASAQLVSQPLNPLSPALFSNENASVFPNRLAENLSVADPTAVTSLTWWGFTADQGGAGTGRSIQNLDGFVITFYSDSAGLPSTEIATVSPSLADLTATQTSDVPSVGGFFYEFEYTLTPAIALPAAGTYWVSIRGDLANPPGPAFSWGRSSTAGVAGAAVDSGSGWGALGASFALEVDGFIIVDSDGDGLLDDDETALQATYPCLDLQDPDSDDDGLSDGDEIDLGTNPCIADTDGDGLSDGDEGGFGTDPTLFDSDGDGLSDGVEVALGTDPTVGDEPADVIAGELFDLSQTVGTTPLGDFAGAGFFGKAVRRAILAASLRLASIAVSNENYFLAALELQAALSRVDGVEPPSDWIIDEPTRAAVAADIEFLLDLVILFGGG
ncbi:MAG: hypothetical protein ACF8R7_11945 [Phycisphaerales bacterium JB039]